MRTLVTGGGGFAGLHLLRELCAAAGDEITATYIGDVPEGDRLGPDLASVEWLPMDLTDPASVEGVVSRIAPERVYHLAGQASVGSSFGAPLATWEVNATGTLRLLEALRSAARGPVRVLLVSSAEVYGAVPVEAQPITEERAYAPLNPYGASKAAAELAGLQAGRAPGIEVVVARSFNHIGPGQDERFVMASMAKQLATLADAPEGAREIRVGNLEVERDFLDVRDVARAYRVLMQRGVAGEVYNVCSGRAVSLREVVERMVRASGTGARIVVDPARVRPADTPVLSGDNGRLGALGWAPEYTLEETLADLLGSAGGGRPQGAFSEGMEGSTGAVNGAEVARGVASDVSDMPDEVGSERDPDRPGAGAANAAGGSEEGAGDVLRAADVAAGIDEGSGEREASAPRTDSDGEAGADEEGAAGAGGTSV